MAGLNFCYFNIKVKVKQEASTYFNSALRKREIPGYLSSEGKFHLVSGGLIDVLSGTRVIKRKLAGTKGRGMLFFIDTSFLLAYHPPRPSSASTRNPPSRRHPVSPSSAAVPPSAAVRIRSRVPREIPIELRHLARKNNNIVCCQNGGGGPPVGFVQNFAKKSSFPVRVAQFSARDSVSLRFRAIPSVFGVNACPHTAESASLGSIQVFRLISTLKIFLTSSYYLPLSTVRTCFQIALNPFGLITAQSAAPV